MYRVGVESGVVLPLLLSAVGCGVHACGRELGPSRCGSIKRGGIDPSAYITANDAISPDPDVQDERIFFFFFRNFEFVHHPRSPCILCKTTPYPLEIGKALLYVREK